MSTDQGSLLLRKQLKELTKHPVDGFSAGLANDDLFEWSVTILGPPETLYEGGFFQATYVRMGVSRLLDCSTRPSPHLCPCAWLPLPVQRLLTSSSDVPTTAGSSSRKTIPTLRQSVGL